MKKSLQPPGQKDSFVFSENAFGAGAAVHTRPAGCHTARGDSTKGTGMKKELSFVTVIGLDKKGIVAKISALLYKNNVNIEDIAQQIMEKHFVMTMLIDIAHMNVSMDTLRSRLEKIGTDLNLKVQLQHENIFKMMHRV
jgi:ACT domain-containing protein